MSIIKKFGNWLHEFVVDLYPYMICLFGACLIGLSSKATGSLFWGGIGSCVLFFHFRAGCGPNQSQGESNQ